MFRLVGGTNIVGEDIVCPTGALQNIPDYEYSTAFGETPLTMENSVAAPFSDMHVYGRSEQVKTKGVNLIPFIVGDKGKLHSVEEDGIQITTDTTAMNDIYAIGNGNLNNESGYEPFDLLTPGTYYAALNESSEKTIMYVVVWRNGTSSVIFDSQRVSSTNNVPFTVESGDKFRIFLRVNAEFNGKVKPMICRVQSDLTAYEPYTGGRPSPNPEYPQEIVSVGGATGQIPLVVRGKNLLKPSFVPDVQGVYAGWKIKDDNKNVVMSIIDKKPNESLYSDLYIGISRNGINANDGVVWKLGNNGIVDRIITSNDNYFTIYNPKNVPLSDIFDRYNIQLEHGTTPTPYEPYREPQTLLLKTPNGLPGVPVKTGGNYTDKNGQQWICDEVDLGRGKYVQRVLKTKPNKTIVFTKQYDNGRCESFNRAFNVRWANGDIPSLSTIAPWSKWAVDSEKTLALNADGLYYRDSTKTLEEINAIFAKLGTNIEFCGVLATPIERDLTPEEIEAYSNLTANDGTTVITVDNENIPTYVSVTYPVIPAYGKMEDNTLRVSKVKSEGFKPILTDSTTYADPHDSVFIGYADRPDSIAKVYGMDPLDERTE